MRGVSTLTMAHGDKLSAVLTEFARTLVTDFPIQDILDRLVERIVEVLPVTSVGITLISVGVAPHYVAASDERALRFERLQTDVGQGPCLSAYEFGEPVAIPKLCGDQRFPNFAPAAVAAGLAAVFAFPLRHGDGRFGALDLYRDTSGELAPRDMLAAQTLADVAAAYLINAQGREDARVTANHFRDIAMHDALTGLPNRALLQQRLDHAAQRAQRSHRSAAVLFADLDQFKLVNDTHGHQVGDELLSAVGQRLSGLVRPGDTLARVSGDEFVFLCEDLRSATDVEVLASRIDESFDAPFVLGGFEISITASVGVAFSGPGEGISRQLLSEADIAMYQAKRKGGAAHQIVDLRADHHPRNGTDLEHDLRTAFALDRLDLAYQPIVRCADGRVTGMEALLRWAKPEEGPVPTLGMVALAEQNGLIGGIGSWVLERGCRDRGRWLREHPDILLDLAVNVSARQVMGPNFCAIIAGVLATTDMDPAALILELTENVFIEDGRRAMTVLRDLKALGVRVALDDFGTGYSSFGYLRRFPVDMLKIDQSFIAEIGRDPAGSAIVAAVTNLAHVLGLTVTAEGVETEQQRDEVIAIGCDHAQGFFYAQPMSALEVIGRLDGRAVGPLQLPAPRRRPNGIEAVRRAGHATAPREDPRPPG